MLASVLKQLPHLKPADLEQVHQRIHFLLGTTKPKDQNQDWLLEGLAAALRRRGLWTKASLPARLLPPNYAEKAEAVRQHLLKGCTQTNLRSAERMALGGLAGMVLIDYLLKIRVPVTPKTLLLNVESVPVALEEAFPDYWANKRLDFCIQVRK